MVCLKALKRERVDRTRGVWTGPEVWENREESRGQKCQGIGEREDRY